VTCFDFRNNVKFSNPIPKPLLNEEDMRVLLIAVVAVLAAASLIMADKFVPTVKFCSSAGAILQNPTYSVEPPNIQPGRNVTVKITGTLTQAISHAEAKLTASFDGIPLLHKSINLCAEAEKHGDKLCPAAAGPFNFGIEHSVPPIPISGSIDLKAVVSNGAGAEIVCVDVTGDV
jgi:hypothetical protein